MPDLKRICKPCPQVKNSIKPRKVINRLPDVDMWMICADGKLEEAKATLVKLFNNYPHPQIPLVVTSVAGSLPVATLPHILTG